ncbi:hypothetical protein DOTSEDRAFT_20276 [Dothistroma septosporum NZE10]|uniref:3-phytase n=1 Tax=Dothistroma septosporum (strain NZE10 / CBS 128990) TaxID=675120 RepID=N1Q288_DOTSN|nr:hypothetical protein DOTSEDRAFT_20276 [Dothistroma septosporum NZE10]
MAVSLYNVLAVLVALTALAYAFDFHKAFVLQAQAFLSRHEIGGTWDVLRHLGGNSPWIRKTRGVLDDSAAEIPAECAIDQVHMMSRHGARYPTYSTGEKMLELYQRLQHANTTFNGSLGFVNQWDFFAPHPQQQLEQLTSTGQYAGTLQSVSAGTELRTKYERLFERALAKNQTSFWSCSCRRVSDTARLFATGFFGIDWQLSATHHVVPETRDRGTNTLTPGRACPNYETDPHGHSFGVKNFMQFRSTYLTDISMRLQRQNSDIAFSDVEIYSMQEMCGFETLAKGHSAWCDIFTQAEMLSFEYARDVLHYYRAGPGNKYGPSMGWLWLNATAELLRQGPEAGPLFFSFNHDGDIIAMLTAFDLFQQHSPLPTSQILQNRTWRTSDVTPMGARVVLERFSCPAPRACWDNSDYGYPNHVYCEAPTSDVFVRVNINEAIVPIPGCNDGPAGSCSLGKFSDRIKSRGEELESYASICGLADDAPKSLDFLHQ